MVSLQNKFGHFCKGTLIAKDVVLCAAHCKGGSYSAVIGRHNLRDKDGETIPMKSEKPHPNYNDLTNANDFLLIFLSCPAKEGKVVKLNSNRAAPSTGQHVKVMGWGNTEKTRLVTIERCSLGGTFADDLQPGVQRKRW
ncbi:hypothetical protein ACHAWF_000933, partial [Thalassiosira exigua]